MFPSQVPAAPRALPGGGGGPRADLRLGDGRHRRLPHLPGRPHTGGRSAACRSSSRWSGRWVDFRDFFGVFLRVAHWMLMNGMEDHDIYRWRCSLRLENLMFRDMFFKLGGCLMRSRWCDGCVCGFLGHTHSINQGWDPGLMRMAMDCHWIAPFQPRKVSTTINHYQRLAPFSAPLECHGVMDEFLATHGSPTNNRF